jgi:PAS domain S-box-containing protein
MEAKTASANLHFLSGGGEMGQLIRAFDWSSTALGSPETWPQSLRLTLSMILASKFPMFLWWGEDLIQFYNDAYRPSLGKEGKHPSALGGKGEDTWQEIWPVIYPLIRQVREEKQGTWSEDQFIPIYRNGELEDVYWTFGYSPIYGEDHNVEGVLVICTETTGKMQTNKRLFESEQRFRNLVRETSLGIGVMTGEDWKLEIVNDAFARVIGRKAEDMLHQNIFAFGPDLEQTIRPLLEEVRETGTTLYLNEYMYSIADPEGTAINGFIDVTFQPYREEDGRITGVMVLCHDVSEKMHSRRKALESEQRLRAVVDSAPFPIAVYIGREMRISLANQAIIDVWGKGDDVIGRTYYELLPELEEQQIFQTLDNVFVTGIPLHMRNERVDLVVDGILQIFYFNYSFTPLFDSDGNVYGVMNTAAEVTDLNVARQKVEQSEQNLRNMVLQAPVAMCILLGAEHVVEVANELMIELWGKPVADVMYKPIFEALPDAREQGLEVLLQTVYTTGETFKATDRPVELLRNGKYELVYQDFVYEPYRNADGTILGVLAISIDVTEQVLARQKIAEVVAERTQELAAANEDLQRSNEELAQFAYIASHDLQEPLRKISTFTEMLQDRSGDRLDEPSKNYLSKINSSALRMNTLIRDVLSYSELVKENVVFSAVDLNEIVGSTISDYELLIEQKGAHIHCDELPTVEAIPLQMSQLFGNLIGNALKFVRKDRAPELRITVETASPEELSAASLDPQTEYYRIVFRDNGIGLKPEHTEKIFQIFQRLHRKSEYEGTGIGLAMCRKIALNHRGELNAEGSSEEGAVFNVLLPFKREA